MVQFRPPQPALKRFSRAILLPPLPARLTAHDVLAPASNRRRAGASARPQSKKRRPRLEVASGTEARLIFEMLHYTLLRLDDAHSTVDRLPGHERGAGSCRPRGEHSNDQHSLISIRTDHTPSGEICCTIEDSGPGIDRSHLSHLFENTFTTKKTGMGMGLIISRSIIEAHDGCIRAENNPARFRTVLPQGKGYAASNTPVRRLQHTSCRPQGRVVLTEIWGQLLKRCRIAARSSRRGPQHPE